jgi:hypothetical protein
MTARSRTFPGLALAAVLAAACTGAPAGAGQTAGGAGATTGLPGQPPTASAPIPAGATAPSGAVPSGAVPSSAASPSSLAPGAYHVTLTGSRAGAGDYSGTMTLYCTSVDNGGVTLWTVAGIDPSGTVRQISLGHDPSGWTALDIGTAGDGEIGPWFIRSDAPQSSAELRVDTTAQPAHVTAQGRGLIGSDPISIAVDLSCSSVNGGGGGTD